MRSRWLGWFNVEEVTRLLMTTVTWLKRATGIGYKTFPPLVDDGHVDPFVAKRLEAHARAMVREVEDLDRELRRSGLGSPRQR